MTNQTKNPIFWCFVLVLVGFTLLIWGVNRNDAIGNYKGAGAIITAAIIFIVGGIGGWFLFGDRKK